VQIASLDGLVSVGREAVIPCNGKGGGQPCPSLVKKRKTPPTEDGVLQRLEGARSYAATAMLFREAR
jgi:hypothetical protein